MREWNLVLRSPLNPVAARKLLNPYWNENSDRVLQEAGVDLAHFDAEKCSAEDLCRAAKAALELVVDSMSMMKDTGLNFVLDEYESALIQAAANSECGGINLSRAGVEKLRQLVGSYTQG